MKILVSACLLGLRCRYDGQSKPNASVLALGEKHDLVPCCPEQLGGLPTPRSPSEWQGQRIVNRAGEDVTEESQMQFCYGVPRITKNIISSHQIPESGFL